MLALSFCFHLPRAAIYTATTVLSLVIANNAAAAIVFPIAATVAVKVRSTAMCGCGWHVHSLVLCHGERRVLAGNQLTLRADPTNPIRRPPGNAAHTPLFCPPAASQDNIDVYILAYAVMLGASAVFASSFGYQVGGSSLDPNGKR